jgi:translocation and assembly module TamB
MFYYETMFNTALTAAMATEVQTLVTGIMTSTGRFADLMTGTNSYANQALATFYGIPGVTGTALNPRVRLFSEPDMSDMDKLSWLLLGRANDTTGGADTALLQRAALALLAGEGKGPTEQFTQTIGLDEISVRQQTEGDTKETIVKVGKQLSKDWYIGYERGLNATAGSWQLIYRLARQLTVRAQAGGDNSLDLIWTLRWQ